ncbi:MAG: redox-sensing transcriptional repressor Rex [Candidatus Omnitrophota bacterium]
MIANKNCIIRLSRYKNAIYRLRDLGFVKVFSENLADATGVTASQVRKDFSMFGITGNRKGGYEISSLIDRLGEILGKNRVEKVVIVGSGHLASALMQYKGFEKEGIKIEAAFDIDPEKFDKNAAIPVLPADELKGFAAANNIKVGILAVPEIAAQRAADAMFDAGIKGIMNFAPIRLKSPNDCTINNVNLEIELENLIYFVNIIGKKEI